MLYFTIMPGRSDQQLVADYLSGDEQSLKFLVERYLKPIYGFIYRFVDSTQDAEDITQDVFVKVWRHIKQFDQKKSFKTWIFSIAKNAAIDFLKKKKTIPFSEFSARGGSAFGGENADGENVLSEKLVDPSPLPSELLERNDLRGTLAKATEKLSPKYRMVLFLRHNDHFTFREIAESLGEPIDTVKSQHRRALILLRKLLLEA